MSLFMEQPIDLPVRVRTPKRKKPKTEKGVRG